MVFDDDKMLRYEEGLPSFRKSFVRVSGYNDIIILKLMVYYKYEYYVTLKDGKHHSFATGFTTNGLFHFIFLRFLTTKFFDRLTQLVCKY